MDWLVNERLTYELKFEPRGQVIVDEGQPTWFSLDTTPRVQYVVFPWMDVLGEVDVAFRNQSNEDNSASVTPRVGVQLHILSQLIARAASHGEENEPKPRFRLDIGTLIRLEAQHNVSGSDAGTTEWQLRYRSEFAYALNRPKTTTDGAIYLKQDTESFIPLNETVTGGKVKELRIRGGLGYRRSFAWRVEALYLVNMERSDTSGLMAVQNHAIDIIVKRQF